MTIAEMRRLFDYTEWANGLVLQASEQLTAEQLRRDVQISYKSILGTLMHMAGAEWIWLERWRGHSPTGSDVWAEWIPNDSSTLQQLQERWRAIVRNRSAFLDQLTDADLPRELAYKRFNGEPYSLPLEQQMQHVVNHATLHRGQVVGMIRQLGLTPPSTDLLFYLMAQRR